MGTSKVLEMFENYVSFFKRINGHDSFLYYLNCLTKAKFQVTAFEN